MPGLFSSTHMGCEFLGLNSSIFKNFSSMLWTLWSVTQQSTTSIFLSVVWVSHYLSVSAQNAEVDADRKNLTYQVASWSIQPFGTTDFHRCQQCRQGAHRPLLGLESMTAYTTECVRHNQSDARPTYAYRPSCTGSTDWYQIILLGNRGRRVNNLPRVLIEPLLTASLTPNVLYDHATQNLQPLSTFQNVFHLFCSCSSSRGRHTEGHNIGF